MEIEFKVKSNCSWSIRSEHKDKELKSLANYLAIEPTIHYSIGDPYPRPDGSVFKRFQHLWSLDSPMTIYDNEEIDHHIQYFVRMLKGKMKLVKSLMDDEDIEVNFLF